MPVYNVFNNDPTAPPVVIGFDPGLANAGYGVIQGRTVLEYGVIHTPSYMELPKRIGLLYKRIQNILKRHPITQAGCERLFFCKNVTTALSVGEARGTIVLALTLANIPIIEFTPLAVKKSVVGYGNAEKKQVQYMVKAILHLEQIPKPDDAADALAIALAAQTYYEDEAIRKKNNQVAEYVYQS